VVEKAELSADLKSVEEVPPLDCWEPNTFSPELFPENNPVEYFVESDFSPKSPPDSSVPFICCRNLAVAPNFLVLGWLCDPSVGAAVAPNMAVAVVVVGVPPNREVAVISEVVGGAPKREEGLVEEGGAAPKSDVEVAAGAATPNSDLDVVKDGGGAPNSEVPAPGGGALNNGAADTEGGGTLNKDPAVFDEAADTPNN